MKAPRAISAVYVQALDAEMNAPFEIAGGAKTAVNNVLVRVSLNDGTIGFGEGAPMSTFNDDSQEATLAAVARQGSWLVGQDSGRWRGILEELDQKLGPSRGASRAALSMAILDAWSRSAGFPLRLLFGGAEKRVASDVTVTILPPEAARAAAQRILRLGVGTIKIKIGRDIDEDVERVRAVAGAGRDIRLLLDANQGYGPRESLKLLARLKRLKIRPVLFEQPAHRDDWRGLRDVWRHGRVPVAADESVASPADALRLVRLKACQVINIKLMKCGLLEAWDIALICRAAGLGLMMGGMIESSLAMACAAHFAAGFGGFKFIDLDTPLWFKKDPMIGVTLSKGGIYDLGKVKAGIGVRPRRALRPSRPRPDVPKIHRS